MPTNHKLKLSLLLIAGILSACESASEKEQRYLEKAHAAFKAKVYDKTKVELKNVLQINPKNTDALFLMAELAEKDQDWRKMYGLLNSIVTDKPEFEAAQLKLGKLLLFGGDPEKAMEKANLILAKHPQDTDAMILKAAVLYQKNDKAASQQLAKDVLAINSGNLEATILLSKLYSETKQYDDIIQLLDSALLVHPEELNLALMKMQILLAAGKGSIAEGMINDLLLKFPEQNSLYYSIAKYHLMAKQADKAEQVLKNLIAKKPSDTEAKLALVEFYANQKEPAKAEESLKLFIKENPDNDDLSFALINLNQNKPEQAISLLNEMIRKNPEGTTAAKAKTLLASQIMKQGDKAKTEELLDEIIKKDPHNADALIMRSTLYYDAGKYEAATADLRTVLRDQPDSEKALILSARTHLKNGFLDLAQESLKNSLSVNPANVNVRKDLARMLALKNEDSTAIELLEDTLKGKQKDPEMLAMLADLYARKGDWPKAESIAKDIANIDNNGLSAFKLAQLYTAQKKYPAAIQAYNEALKIKPNAIEILAGLTNTYLAAGEASKATTLINQLSAAHPENIDILNLKGFLHQNQKQYAEAEQVFQKVINAAKGNEIGYNNLANIYIQQQQFDKAEKVYQQGIQTIPKSISLRQNLAVHYEKTAKFEKAIECYEQILKLQPDSQTALNNLAALTAESTTDPKRLSDVLAMISSFRDHKDPASLDTFGWLSYLNGNIDDAVSALEKVVKLQPDFPEFNYHLAMAYAAKGRTEESKAALEKALAKNPEAPWVAKAQAKLAELKSK